MFPTFTAFLVALNAWAAGIRGKYVDRDGFPPSQPYQCHDVLLDFIVDVMGLSLGAGHAGGDGWTDEVWKRFPWYRPELATRFTKHVGTAGLRAGDVVFWPYGSMNHPWSHIVVAMSGVDEYGYILCVSQNPGPVDIIRLPAYQALGYLRPIITEYQIPLTPAPEPEEEDEDMSRPVTFAKVKNSKEYEVTTYFPDTGEERVFTQAKNKEGESYIRNVALTYGCAPDCPFSILTPSHYDAVKREFAASRKVLASRK